MNGYILFRNHELDDAITQANGKATTGTHLLEALNALVPEGATILGIVFTATDARTLNLVA